MQKRYSHVEYIFRPDLYFCICKIYHRLYCVVETKQIFSEPWTYKQQHKKRLITHISPKQNTDLQSSDLNHFETTPTINRHWLRQRSCEYRKKNKHINTEFCCIRLRESKLKIYTAFIYLYKYIYISSFICAFVSFIACCRLFLSFIHQFIAQKQNCRNLPFFYFSIYWMKVSFSWCINVILNLALT